MAKRLAITLAFLVFCSSALAEGIDPEQFLSPTSVTNFTEQLLTESIRSYVRGNLAEAAGLQRKLARYYAEKGDNASSLLCEQRAKAAEAALQANRPEAGKSLPEPAVIPESAPQHTERPAASERKPAGKTSAFSGRYYGMVQGTLHKWDFNQDGTFSHQVVSSGSGTSVRNFEKGTFAVSGSNLELTIEKEVSAFVTPGVETGGRSTTVLGSGSDAKKETRRLSIKLLGSRGENGIIVGGKTMKVRSWQ